MSTQLHVLYRFFGLDDELLYIGITGSPWYRFHAHESSKAWFKDVTRAAVEHFANREDLVEAEIKAIQTELPKYNGAYVPSSHLAEGVRGHGRPPVGTPVNVRLGDELLAEVDAYAEAEGIKRAAAIRQLVQRGLRKGKW